MIIVKDSSENHSIGYLINLLARLLAQNLRARNGADGILPGQFPVVLRLLESERETQKSLADYIRVGQATMAHTLKRMEAADLIKRRPMPGDRRQFSVHLTAKGSKLADTAVQNAENVNRIALSGLSEQERERLRELLANMADSLGNDLEKLNADMCSEPGKNSR